MKSSGDMMKAVVLTDYKDYRLQTVPIPRPGRDEVLCKIKASAICGTDPKIIAGERPGVWPQKFPHIMGHEWSGEVIEVGNDVNGFKAGDRVSGEAHCGCGKCRSCLEGQYTICLNYGKLETGARHFGFNTNGSNAEYGVFPEKVLHKLPRDLSYLHASLADIVGVSLHSMETVGVTPGGNVAIFGPGPAGIAAMQLAKGMGASKVIMVGRGPRLDIARKLGVDHAVDFTKDDPVEAIRSLTHGRGVDEAFECSGAPMAPAQCLSSLRKGGSLGIVGVYNASIQVPNFDEIVDNQLRVIGTRATPNLYHRVLQLLLNGVVDGDTLITHTFRLEEYHEAMETFVNRIDNSLKVVILPEQV